VARLKPLLVSVASASNPLDLTPTTALRAESLEKLPEVLDVAAAEENIDSVLFIIGGLAARANELREIILTFWRRCPKPVYVSWPSPPAGVAEWLAQRGVPLFEDPARLISAIGRLADAAEARARPVPPDNIPGIPIDWKQAVPQGTAPNVVSEHQCHAILSEAGLPVAAARLARSEQAARDAARLIGFPVVLKAISPQVTHRAAAGLLAMDLRSEAEVSAAYRQLETRATDLNIRLDGIYVQRIHKGGLELLVAAVRDPMFGTMITCGHGGGMAELIDTVVIHRAPVDIATAADMIGRLRLGKASGSADPLKAADFVARFSQLAVTAPFRRFTFEVNPIKWSAEGAIAVDGLLIVEQD
jgi:acyl-CoA synthetase (NDP forming)